MDSRYFDSIDTGQGFSLALRDGGRVDFRPVRPDDKGTLQKGMLALSMKSRYFRFFSPILTLSAAQLRDFTEVDQHGHVAWIALADNGDGPQGVGIARFIRLQEQPEIAEFGVVVIDSCQQRGVGTVLLSVLDRIAYIKGIKTLRGFVLADNAVTRTWLGKLGAAIVCEQDCYRVDLPVKGGRSPFPNT
ncbi:MAG: GNAT family N-acetyltransferase [Methylovulum sp.]|nr:GNAT family N-acetyltransferase [Methylovulum sp.]